MTGTNTDRLKEEQERGISIDLGFSYLDTPGGNRLGIVDVPGHERFINNMVAGVVGMDLILLVIAADEGIMPQTREHMDILSLLGIEKAIVVLNKIDLVDNEWVELVEADVKAELSETFMKDAPILRVSSFTGAGIQELISEIEKLTETNVEERDSNSIACLPIDRVFTIKGSGTVVTGTLISGQIKQGDELEIFPVNKKSKIRSVQVHNSSTDTAFAGQRVALNLAGIEKNEIYRGCVVAEVDSIIPTDIIDVRLSVLKSSKRVIENGSRVHFFSGTSEVLARVFLLDKEKLLAGEDCLAQLRLDKKIAVKRNDRFVVRFYSPLETIGGGQIIEANAKKVKRFDSATLDKLAKIESGSIEDNILSYIDSEIQPILNVSNLAKLCANSEEEVLAILNKYVEDGQVTIYKLQNEQVVWSNNHKESCLNKLLENLDDFHNKNPYKIGKLKAEVYNSQFNKCNKQVFDAVISEFENNNFVKTSNEFLSDAKFSINKDDTYLAIEKIIIENLEQARFNFVWFSDIDFKNISEKYVTDVRVCLENENKIVKVAENLFTLKKYIDEAKKKIIEVLKVEGRITISEVRDLLETSRKVAKPILEYTDNLGITIKSGGEAERDAGNLEADG